MNAQKTGSVRGLLLVLSLFLFISVVSAADVYQSWDCNTPGAGCVNFRVSAYRDGSHSLSCGMARPVYNQDPSTNFRFTPLSFSVSQPGNYQCTIAITETGYSYYSRVQTNENVQVSLNGVDLGRTTDHRCNSGSFCASCTDGTTYITRNVSLSSSNNIILEAFDSHALRSTSISCDRITSTPTCISFTYSNWSSCNSSGIQTRTILSRLPANCIGGNPAALSQSCNYTSPQNNSSNITIINNTIINVNNTYINITNYYNVSNYITINVTQNNIYNVYYILDNISNSTIINGNTTIIYLQPIYNITIYVINNITNNYYYNYTIIYNNSSNNTSNSTNGSSLIPSLHIISPHNGTLNLCSNNTLLNVLASWSNNISVVDYSLNGNTYSQFEQNMSLNFSYGWNELRLISIGTNGTLGSIVPLADYVRLYLSASCEEQEEQTKHNSPCNDWTNPYSDEDQTIFIDNSPSLKSISLTDSSDETLTSPKTNFNSIIWLDGLLLVGILLGLILLFYLLL